MINRITQMVAFFKNVLLVLLLCSCGFAIHDGASSCQIETVTVDRHLFRNAMASEIRPTIGWLIPPACGTDPQTSFSVTLADAQGHLLWSSSRIMSNRSDSVPYSVWMHSDSKSEYLLRYGTEYQLNVAVTLGGTRQLPLSSPAIFVTRLSSAQVHV